MKVEHTPGPWMVEESTPGDGHHFIKAQDGTFVVFPDDGWNESYRNYEERLANAHLIAAAPELYEALKHLCNEITLQRVLRDQNNLYESKAHELAVAAIMKAEGR